MRTLLKLGLVLCPSLACFASSGEEPQTYVISELIIPIDADDERSSDDLDGDGRLDNSLPLWLNAADILGLDIQQQLTEQINSGEYLFGVDFHRASRSEAEFSMFRAGSLAPPRFDGSDQIFSTGEALSFSDVIFDKQSAFDKDDSSVVRARGATLDWLLFPFGVGDLLTVPLLDSKVEASFSDDDFTLEGKITGHVNLFDAALVIESAPDIFGSILEVDSLEFGGGAAIPCEADAAGSSGTCAQVNTSSFCSDRILDQNSTGVCVPFDSMSRRLLQFLDGNKDGRWSVDFDEQSGLFIENELTFMFDLRPGASPGGFIGSMFTLDLNQDGLNDSMPIGVQFTAVRANQK